MAVTFTAAKTLLALEATILATEATVAGLTTLSTALTDLSTEIAQSVTEEEFFGGGTTNYAGGGGGFTGTEHGSAAIVWSKTLDLAAAAIRTKNSSLIKVSLDNIATDIDAIATDIDAIATDIDTIASNSTTIKDKQTILADKQTAIETYQKKLKELGETTGIRSRGPFESWGNISTYKFLIEQGKILDQENAVSPEKYAQALAAVQTYLNLINEKGKEF